ncbi:LysR family transcriptional regulator [Novosphingobium umbonatum]|uniref:LysR family transcriptional regulator n=1 Tax=Novosphingobium umbonatum TaxID=1908524 RepID=A0A3S2V7L3_9SPHN|nr:LysR family transcriptional regulator [Novosphingobium umbonatum]RVU05667.1 LysR family transcriptional regulator [Novosphingobium umbonatum]
MDYRRFDLNLLVVLDALLEEGGVNAAARRLGMSQPNVSFALSKLRHSFADQLLVRHGAGMRPTPLAENLREPVKRVLNGIENDIFAERKFDPAVAERRFVLSTSDIGELVFLPHLMRKLADEAPGITLECRSLAPTDLAKAMAHGEVDLALGYFPDLVGEAFIAQHLFDHPFTCIARKDHPAMDEQWSLERFLQLGHIVVSQSGRSQELFEAQLQRMELSRRILLQSPHFMSVPLLVAQSDLISTVPKAVGAIMARSTPLCLIDPPFPTPSIVLQQHWHLRSQDDPAAIWMRALIAGLFKGRDPSLCA